MKQILLPVVLALSLTGCAASLIYDQDRTPRDCRPDSDNGQRCPGLAEADDSGRLAWLR